MLPVSDSGMILSASGAESGTVTDPNCKAEAHLGLLIEWVMPNSPADSGGISIVEIAR